MARSLWSRVERDEVVACLRRQRKRTSKRTSSRFSARLRAVSSSATTGIRSSTSRTAPIRWSAAATWSIVTVRSTPPPWSTSSRRRSPRRGIASSACATPIPRRSSPRSSTTPSTAWVWSRCSNTASSTEEFLSRSYSSSRRAGLTKAPPTAMPRTSAAASASSTSPRRATRPSTWSWT